MAFHSGWLYVAGDGEKMECGINENDFDIS